MDEQEAAGKGCRAATVEEREFFRRDCVALSKALLGRVLVRVVDAEGRRLSGRIVEVEAYLGGEDKAAHSYLDRRTPKNASMFLDAGHSYVYKSFRGRNDCFNITSDSAGVPAAVLIRALEPLDGVEDMYANAQATRGTKKRNRFTVCAGPGRLCQAMGITRDEFDGVDLVGNDRLWLEDDGVGPAAEDEIVATPRINVQYAEEWSAKARTALLRFCWAPRKRYLSIPIGGTQSPVSPAMLFSAPLAEAVAVPTAAPDDTQRASPALLTDT